jgi:predicted dehydrogenase
MLKEAKIFAKKWNIPEVFEDYNKMYDDADLDAVFICLPNFLHYNAAKSALEHDMHVFCEKPMGLSADEAYELVKKQRKGICFWRLVTIEGLRKTTKRQQRSLSL